MVLVGYRYGFFLDGDHIMGVGRGAEIAEHVRIYGDIWGVYRGIWDPK